MKRHDLPGPPRTAIAVAARRAVHGIGNRIEVARLDADPDPPDELSDALDAQGIRRDRLNVNVGLLGLGNHRELQPDRFVGQLLDQLVIEDELPFGRVDITGRPAAPRRFEVGHDEGVTRLDRQIETGEEIGAVTQHRGLQLFLDADDGTGGTNNRASVRFPYQPARSICVLWSICRSEPTRDARWTAPRHARPIRESAGSGFDRRAGPTVGGVLTAEEEITTRKPLFLFRLSGVFLFRLAERVFLELLFHEPPRNTRFPRIP